MAFDPIPRTHCFSLGDFHDFDRCVFRFFVNHHLQKKYELSEGNPAQATGTLLDLTIKKLHLAHAYGQPADYLVNLVKAAQNDIKTDVEKNGPHSFYGSQVDFLTPQVVEKAEGIFKNYYQGLKGQVKRMVATPILKGPKPFWKLTLKGAQPLMLWGGPDSIELGEDGIPEIVDYKYLEKGDESTEYLDMDLMPKLYTLLCAAELLNLGYRKTRFVIRLWHDPNNTSYYEEFNLSDLEGLKAYFQDKAERILRTTGLTFCDKDFCKVCQHADKELWLKELQNKGWINPQSVILPSLTDNSTASDGLSF